MYDCEDTSDEEDCTCKDYLRYERPSAICDGRVDCLDGSDEQECGNETLLFYAAGQSMYQKSRVFLRILDFCDEDQYHCHRSGGCIPKDKRCDKLMDCRLNEDELDCCECTFSLKLATTLITVLFFEREFQSH